jgi:hypothetical protein
MAKTRLRGRRPHALRLAAKLLEFAQTKGLRGSGQRLRERLWGVLNPRVCRGRPLSSAAIASSAAWSSWRRSALLARYWRNRPLVFSLVPRRQGLLAEVDLDARVDGELQVFGHLPAIAAVALDQGPDCAGSLAEHQVAFPMPRHRSGPCWMPSGCRGRAGRVSLQAPTSGCRARLQLRNLPAAVAPAADRPHPPRALRPGAGSGPAMQRGLLPEEGSPRASSPTALSRPAWPACSSA